MAIHETEDEARVLRRRAEHWLVENPGVPLPEESLVLHELEVHQVELQIQNEELRATQSQLSAAREEYVDLYERAPVGYCTLSSKGRILKANGTLAGLLGFEASTLVGQNLTAFSVPADQDKLYLTLRGLMKKPAPTSVVLQMRKSTGEVFWSRVDAHRIDVAGQNPVIRVVLNDMTTQKIAEDTLEVNARLESLGALAAGIAHDFNNLLGGILGYVSLARATEQASAEVVAYLDKAEAVFDRARNLTQQLMAFAKQSPHQTKVVAFQPLVEKAAAFILSGSQTVFHVTGAEDLWPALLDEAQIGQVIDNLVLNASQAMAGLGRVLITLSNATLTEAEVPGLEAGFYLRMTVTDSGPGIPAELLSKVFAPFFTTKSGGHGLGLASAQSIVRRHGGAIWGEAAPGKGTAFHVLLPAIPAGMYAIDAPEEQTYQGHGTVLLLDDEEFNLEILAALLKSLGYETLCAREGNEALELCRSKPPLVAAFLDLTNKRGPGGRPTVMPLLALYPCLPIFAVSGYSEDPVMANPQEFGFADSLFKPFRRDDLTLILAKYL